MLNQSIPESQREIPKAVKRIAALYFWLGVIGIVLTPVLFYLSLFLYGMSDAPTKNYNNLTNVYLAWLILPILASIFSIILGQALKRMRWWALYVITGWFVVGVIGILAYKYLGKKIEVVDGLNDLYFIVFQIIIIFYLWRGYRQYYQTNQINA